MFYLSTKEFLKQKSIGTEHACRSIHVHVHYFTTDEKCKDAVGDSAAFISRFNTERSVISIHKKDKPFILVASGNSGKQELFT